ncbi:MAG: hypothetical protein AAF500_00420 [Myxococcota bacterium]
MPRVPRADASYETRGQIFAPSIRLSHFEATNRYTDDTARDFYFSPGVGFRVASPLGHALLVDGEYRFPGNIAVSLDARDYAPIRFGVIHLGYAFRYLAGRSRVPRRRRRWTITPHLSLSTGAARKRDSETVSGVPLRSPVVGARVGVDLDVHIRRVFFGWSFGYEYLRHTRGTLTRSNFFIWNVLPLLRIGVNFGRSIR